MSTEHIGLTDPDGAEITTDAARVTGKHLFADGGDGKEKEANVLHPQAGASSEADPSSGIPSALKQHGMTPQGTSQDETPAACRVVSTHQNDAP